MKGQHTVNKERGYPEGVGQEEKQEAVAVEKALSFTVPCHVCDAGNKLLPLNLLHTDDCTVIL